MLIRKLCLCQLLAVCLVAWNAAAAATAGDANAPVDEQDPAIWNKRSVQIARTNPELARSHAETALRLAEQDHQQALAAMAHVNIGRANLLLGDHPAAVRAMQTGLDAARQHAGARDIAVAAESLAVALDRVGLYEQSLRLHQEALTQFESATDLERMAQVLVNLGNLYDNMGQKQASRAHYLRALSLLDRVGAESGRASIYNNLSQLDDVDTPLSESLGLIERAISLYQQENNQIGLGLAYRNQAMLLIKADRLEAAAKAVTAAKTIADKTGHRVGQAAALEAEAKLAMAQAAQSKEPEAVLKAAEAPLQQALALADELADPDRQERLLNLQAAWFEQRALPADALVALKAAHDVHQRREQVSQSQRLQALSAQFQSEQQQAELRRLQAEANTQQGLLTTARWQRNGIIIVVLLLVVLAVLALQWVRTRDRLLRTERAQNAALQQALASLAQAQRVAEEERRINGELLALAAHDVQSSMNRVLANAERLLGSAQLPTDGRQQVASLATTANEVVDTIANLVVLTSLEQSESELNRSRFDLRQLLDDLVTQAQGRAAEKRLKLVLYADVSGLEIQADRLRLAEAIEQLIGNAIKFSPPNRRIDVQLTDLPELVRIEIHDEGPGLSEADQRRVFGRFQRLSARPTGGERSTGLGLALVKRIADLHGGRASFAPSRLQGGICFYLELPKRQADRLAGVPDGPV